MAAISLALLLVVLAGIVRQSRRRDAGTTSPGAPLELLLLPMLMSASSFEQDQRYNLLGVGVALGLAFLRTLSTNVQLARIGPPALLALAGAAVPWSQGNSPTPLLQALLIIAIALLQPSVVSATRAFVQGCGLYCAVNLTAFFVLGLRGTASSQRSASLDSSIGVFQERAFFPLAESLAEPGVFGAIAVAGSAVLLRDRTGSRGLHLGCLASGLLLLLAVNVRAALLVALITVIWAVPTSHRLRSAAWVAVPALFAAPLFFGVIKPVVSPALTAIESVPGLSRQDEGSLSQLNNRETIWRLTMERFAQLPTVRQLAGHGPEGQVESGASNEYAALFGSDDDFGSRIRLTPHSSALQILLDGGAISLVLLLMSVVLALRRHSESGHARLLFVGSVVPLLAGVSESFTAPGNHLTAFYVLLLFLTLSGGRATPQPSSPQGERLLVSAAPV